MDTFTSREELGDCCLKPAKPKLTLLGLPREMRDRIFEVALVETIRWERRHKYNCPHCPRTSHELEYPTFQVEHRPSSIHYCRCYVRSSLNLLLVNRQVNAEAARIFWKNNTFCFKSMTEFSHDLGEALRPEYREMIQHISFGDHSCWVSKTQVFEDFWNTLLRCTGLRTLELHFNAITAPMLSSQESCRYFLRMKTELANLKSVKWLCYGPLMIDMIHPMPEVNGPNASDIEAKPRIYPDLIYWETTKEVDLERLNNDEDVERNNTAFARDFINLLTRAMDTYLFEESPTAIRLHPEYRKLCKCLPDGLNDRDNERTLDMEDASVATVWFYGIPLSRETVMHNAKLRGEDEQTGLEQLSGSSNMAREERP